MAEGFKIAEAFVEIETEDNTHRGLSRITSTVMRWGAKLAEGIGETLGTGMGMAAEMGAKLVNQALGSVSKVAMNTGASLASASTEMATLGTATTASTGGLNLIIPALLAVASAVAMAATGFVALAPAVLLVGGAVGGATTAVFGAVAAFAVLKIGTMGITDAFSEFAKTGKITDETLKKLAPSARAFVREVIKLKKPFDRLKRSVQEALFKGMSREFRNLAKRWLPALKPLLTGLAGDINAIGVSIMRALGKPDFIKNIRTAVKGFGDFLVLIGANIDELISAFGKIAAAAVPWLRELGSLIGDAFGKFNEWITKAEKSGALADFFENATQTLKDLWSIGGLVFKIVGDLIEILFPGSDQAADSIFAGVRTALTKIEEWLSDPKNQQKIRDFIDKIIDGVTNVINWFRDPKNQEAIKEWVTRIAGWVTTVAGWIGTAQEWKDRIQGWIDKVKEWGQKLLSFVDSIKQKWDELKTATQEKWDAIVEFFRTLPEKIGAAIAAIPGKVRDTLTTMATTGMERVGFFIGQVVGTMLTLPIRIGQAIASLPGTVRAKFESARATAQQLASTAVSQAVGFFTQLPGRVASALSGLPGRVQSTFSSARSQAVGVATDLVNRAVGIIRGLPDRARSALGGLGGVLVAAGRSLIQGLINGINDKIGPLKAALQKISGLIPDWKGPLDHDKKMLVPAGQAIMGGLMKGIDSQVPALRDQLQGLTGAIGTLGAIIGTRPAAAGAGGITIQNLHVTGIIDPNDSTSWRRFVGKLNDDLYRYRGSAT